MFESEIAVPRRSRVLLIVAAIFAVLVIGLMSVAGFITDRMWFGSVGATGVFDSILITKIGLFVFGALVSALVMTITMRLAYASRPAFRAPSDIPGIEQAQEALESLRKIGFIVVPVLVGLLSGLALSTDWQTWMMFRNGQSFGITDSVFNLDVSFFTFELPFWRMLQSFLMTILVISAIASAAVMYLSGSVRPNNQEGRPGLKMTDGARRQIAVFGGTFLLLQAWSLWLDRFDLVTKDDTLITGLTFVDANVNLPALNILTGVSVIVALLFFFNVIRTNWTLPILGSILLVLSSLLLGGAWPAFVQQVQVKPDQQAKETPFIQRNIESTRVAYDLDDVVYSSYDAVETPDANILKGDTKTLESIRLLDPSVVASTFEQLQQLKGFYGFADTLDVSRYSIDGEKRGTVMAVREVNLAGVPESQRNWVTDALIYTHGIGLAAAYDNTSTTDGQPAFIESDVPPKGVLGIKEPRIYFGEQSPVYSIVGGSTKITQMTPAQLANKTQPTLARVV
jgi:uncharacterized membrane protein (UPF0182 family)